MGAGKVNAPGGHIEVGETPEECAIREAFEEVGIAVLSVDLRAMIGYILILILEDAPSRAGGESLKCKLLPKRFR